MIEFRSDAFGSTVVVVVECSGKFIRRPKDFILEDYLLRVSWLDWDRRRWNCCNYGLRLNWLLKVIVRLIWLEIGCGG